MASEAFCLSFEKHDSSKMAKAALDAMRRVESLYQESSSRNLNACTSEKSPVLASHIRKACSAAADSATSSDRNAHACTRSLCPVNVITSSPDRVSQILRVQSKDAVTSSLEF